jgi:Leucine-rich repeat (LRR) protein
MASSSTGTLPDEVLWEELPEELLMRVLGHVMLRYGQKWRWCGAVRGVSRQWRAVHDGVCESLSMRHGVTDEGMQALCVRLPALTYLDLGGVKSLTADGLRELRGLTSLTFLCLGGCTDVTDVGIQHLSSLTALTSLDLDDTSTTQA